MAEPQKRHTLYLKIGGIDLKRFAQVLLGAGCALAGWLLARRWVEDKAIDDFYACKDTVFARVLQGKAVKVYKGKGVFHCEPTGETGIVFDLSSWTKDGDVIGIYVGDTALAGVEDYIGSAVEVYEFEDGFKVWRPASGCTFYGMEGEYET